MKRKPRYRVHKRNGIWLVLDTKENLYLSIVSLTIEHLWPQLESVTLRTLAAI